MTVSNTIFTVFSGLGLVLSLIPLWWHLKSRSVGTSMFMIWTALACLAHFVDSIIWNGNAINWAPVWCDINIRIQLGAAIAFPACGLCILRRLYYISCNCTSKITWAEKRRSMIIDLLITVGIPVLQIVVEHIVAGHRFNIIEDYGCAPATWNTPLAYVLVWSWPLVIGAVSACYGALTIRALVKRRNQCKDLISANVNLSYNYYWRLIALASVDFCFTLPLAIRAVVLNSLAGVSPWVSWADTHSGYSRVFQTPRIVLDQHPILVYGYEITRWAPVLCAFVFFAFFGFAGEARRNYRLFALTIAKFLGFTVSTESAPAPGSCVIDHSLHFVVPISVTQQTVSGRDSDSFSDKPSTEVSQPEPALNPGSVRPFDPDAPMSVHSHKILDRV